MFPRGKGPPSCQGVGCDEASIPRRERPGRLLGHEMQTIHPVDHPTSGTVVGVGSLTGCEITSARQGGYMAGYAPVVDVATGGEIGNARVRLGRV